ncbi:MAG TPA: BON domain-containing protein [Terriglobales bacterium]|nr:BON domain-containing protein [Terriglobales bacterium]
MRRSVHLAIGVFVIVLGLTAACTRVPNDSAISSQVQSKFGSDSGLQGKDLSVQSANGTVTLSGNVDNEAQREAAARYAASIPGVKQVVNNLLIATPPAAAVAAPAPAPVVQQAPPPPVETPKPVPVKHVSAPKKHAVVHDTEMAAAGAGAGAAGMGLASQDSGQPALASAPTAPPPPPPPPKATIPPGTNLAVRLIDSIDSEKSQPGETFRATLNSPLATEGDIAIPAGYDVEGHIVDVKSAGKFAGKSLLILQLDRINVGGKSYSIQTDQYKREGSSRGTNTAEKVGAGAAIGAIIGGIAGGGKGAAIGAAAGGGVGGGVQAATKGQQIKLPSETVLNFTLQNPVTVVVAQSPDSHRQRMDTPSNPQ